LKKKGETRVYGKTEINPNLQWMKNWKQLKAFFFNNIVCIII